MKKLTALFVTIIMIFAVGCGLMIGGCGAAEEDAVQNMEGGIALANFDCTITLTSYDPIMEGEPAVFKSDIKTSDITLADGLKGKTVSSVTFVDSETIKVSLTGRVSSFDANDPYGKIIVSKRALENGKAGFANILIKKAELYVRSASSNSSSGTYKARIMLNVGEFNANLTKQDVSLASGSDGVINYVAIEDGYLVIEVIGASKKPSVVISASATTFNKQVTIALVSGASVALE